MKVKLLRKIRKRFEIKLKYDTTSNGMTEITYYVFDRVRLTYTIEFTLSRLIENCIDDLYPDGNSKINEQKNIRAWIIKQKQIENINRRFISEKTKRENERKVITLETLKNASEKKDI